MKPTVLAITVTAVVCGTAAADSDKCAPLINDLPKYQACRMGAVSENLQKSGGSSRTERPASYSTSQYEGTRNDPAIGLTYQELVTLFNKGKPLYCNTTKTRYGEHLQCWYNRSATGYPIMYFDDGKLTATQR